MPFHQGAGWSELGSGRCDVTSAIDADRRLAASGAHQAFAFFSEQNRDLVSSEGDGDFATGACTLRRDMDFSASCSVVDVDHLPDFLVVVGDRVSTLEIAPFGLRNGRSQQIHEFLSCVVSSFNHYSHQTLVGSRLMYTPKKSFCQ